MNPKLFMVSTLLVLYLASVPVLEGQVSTKDLPPGAIKRFTHGVSVYTVAFSPDGQRLASGGNNNAAILWNVANRNAPTDLRGHTKSVMSVAFSPDGKYLATASHDGFVRLWNVASKRRYTTFTHTHTGWAKSVAFSPDGKRLASGGGNQAGSVMVWDVSRDQRISAMAGHTGIVESVAFSPDGRLLASASRDKTVKLWDVETQQVRQTLTQHKNVVYAVAFSPDGRTLATSSRDYTLKLWDVVSGENVATFEIDTSHYIYAEALAFSPDGRYLASACVDYTIRLWDIDNRSAANTLRGHDGAVTAVAFSADGTRLASGSRDRTVLLWELSHFNIVPFEASPHASVSPKPQPKPIVTDTTPPHIVIRSPKADQVPATLEHLMIRGEVSDATHIREVSVAGQAVSVSADGRFTATVALDPHENVIHVTATDVYGNMDTKRLTIRRQMPTDLEPPVLTYKVLPATTDAGLTVQGSVADESDVAEVTLNNRTVSVSEDGSFRKTLRLAVGENEVRLTATDIHGNMETSRARVFRTLPPIDEKGPDIRIHEPTTDPRRGIRSLITIETPSVTVSGTATDPSGVSEVTVDGNAVAVNGTAFRATVSLQFGDNSIPVSATDTLGNLSEKNVLIFRPHPDPRDRQGKDFALLFAVEDYHHWEKLRKPIYDAVSIQQDLENIYGFQTELIKNPTQAEIFKALRAYAEKEYTDADQLLIFFAGHGYFDETFDVGSLVARDTRKPEDDKELLSYISHSVIRDIVDRFTCKHIFLVLDTCYSGTFDRRIAMRGHADDRAKPLTPDDIQRKLEYTTRRYLTSGGKEQVPDDSKFVRAFLEALRSQGGVDNILTLDDVSRYMETLDNPKPRASGFGSDEPGSDFLFFAK